MGGGFKQRTARPRRGQDIEHPVEITLEEAFSGTTRNISIRSEASCAACHGTGRIQNLPCSVCRGAGVVPQIKRLEVKIPAGVNNGSRVRIPGKGEPASAGGTPGDLYLVISLQHHNLFTRKDDDLLVDIPVPLTTAILGGEVQCRPLKYKAGFKSTTGNSEREDFPSCGPGYAAYWRSCSRRSSGDSQGLSAYRSFSRRESPVQ